MIGVTASGLGALFHGMAEASENTVTGSKQPDVLAWERKVPLRWDTDIVVVGGGMAGVGAAAAAARTGARVLLVERFAVTGGMLTVGGVANFCGDMEGQGEVFDEILEDLHKWKALGGPSRDSVFHYETLAFVLQELLLRRDVKLLLHTRFVDLRVTNGNITELLLYGTSGLEAVRTRQVIDCTGEGDVARAAGFSVMKGRNQDGLQLPMSMMYFVRHVQEEGHGPLLPEGWLTPVETKEDLPMTSIWPDGPGANAIKVKVPAFDSTDTESLTAAEIAARRRIREVMHYHQSVEKRPWILDHCSPIIGIREGVRILGDYVLTVEDLRAGKRFEDGIARGCYELDGHKPDDEKRTYILPEEERTVPPYQIPLRSLIAKEGNNLLMAGRCFSADQLALSSARVSTTACMMGQAAGIAAALAVQKGTDLRNVDPKEVQEEIRKRGAVLDL
jgi:hypothetical protein